MQNCIYKSANKGQNNIYKSAKKKCQLYLQKVSEKGVSYSYTYHRIWSSIYNQIESLFHQFFCIISLSTGIEIFSTLQVFFLFHPHINWDWNLSNTSSLSSPYQLRLKSFEHLKSFFVIPISTGIGNLFNTSRVSTLVYRNEPKRVNVALRNFVNWDCEKIYLSLSSVELFVFRLRPICLRLLDRLIVCMQV